MLKQNLMLAKTSTVESLSNPSLWEGYIMQQKYDGMRAAIIREGNEVMIYSRSHHEYTEHLPHLVEVIKNVPSNFGDIHLDGELVFIKDWKEVRDIPVPVIDFNQTMRIMGSNAPLAVEKQKEVGWITFIAYDWIGCFNHECPLEERTAELLFFDDIEHIVVSPYWVDWDVKLYEELVEAGSEGIMLKNQKSLYQSGRPNKTWYKIKSASTYDVIAYDFYEGTGKHAGRLGGIRFGAHLPTGEFKSVGKCGGGFTDEERDSIWNQRTPFMGRVFEIKSNDTVGSGVYRTPRHPQFINWRVDKSPLECSMDQFAEGEV